MQEYTEIKKRVKNIDFLRKYFKYANAFYVHRLNISMGNSKIDWLRLKHGIRWKGAL